MYTEKWPLTSPFLSLLSLFAFGITYDAGGGGGLLHVPVFFPIRLNLVYIRDNCTHSTWGYTVCMYVLSQG